MCSRRWPRPSTRLSRGRLVVALGAGWNRTEFDAFGIPFDRRASRFEEAFEIVRRLLAGERVTFAGQFHEVTDAVLLPKPARRAPLMVGSTGERVLAATLPYVEVWNTWFDWYGNTPEGFAQGNAKMTELCERAGRDPEEVERSACVLVVTDANADERPREGVTPLAGSPEDIAQGLRAMAEAGADEVILVLDPCTEASIRAVAQSLAILDA